MGASFVRKTTDGMEARESLFVTRRLRDLAQRIRLQESMNRTSKSSKNPVTPSPSHDVRWPMRGDIVIEHHTFCKLLDDDVQIRCILQDLGLDVRATDLFHIVDTSQNGSVDIVELLD